MKQLTLKRNRLADRVFLSLIGTLIVAVGIRLIVLSALGADALSTFILGILNHFSLQFGTVSLLINIVILIVVFFNNRQMIGLASLINSFGIGIFLNLFDWLKILQNLPQGFHYAAVFVGPVLFALGTALYLLTNTGSGAYECLMVLVKNRLGWSVRAARIFLDGIFMLIGFLLGGPVGIGTIIVLVLLGPTLDFFLRKLPEWQPKYFKFDD